MTTTIVFYDDEQRNLPTNHNRPICVTTSVREVKLKRAMLDPWLSLNIISLSILDAISMDRITKYPIEVSSYRGNCTYKLWAL